MPKRYGHIYEKIYEWDNLLSAFHKASKSKKNRREIVEFEYNLEKYLLDIQREFEEQSFKFGGYKEFKIFEPKERTISCASFKDRVVHHAICNILNPLLDGSIISDSYACRKGKGLHRAIKRAFYFYRNSSYCYKFDIRKYFYTIDQQILLEKLERKIKDPKLIILIKDLLSTYKTGADYFFPFNEDDVFDYARRRGLPIGNLTSQIFANFYLSELDHYVKEELHQSFYIRYMDDVLIFSDNKEKLNVIKDKVENKLKEYRLHLHTHKNTIIKTKRGVNFLGFRFHLHQIRLQNKNLVRFKRNIRKRADMDLPVSEQLCSINGNLGFLFAGNTRKIIEKVFIETLFIDNGKKYNFSLSGNNA